MYGASLRTFGILTVTIFVCAGLVALLMLASNSLTTITMHPADILPAQGTVAVFMNADEEVLRKFEGIFPELSNISPAPGKTIAVLQLDQDIMTAQIQNIGQSQQREETANALFLGPFRIELSHESAVPLFRETGLRLAASDPYKKLAAQKVDDLQWVFLDLAILPSPSTVLQNIAHTLIPRESTHAAFTFSNRTYSVELFGAKEIEHKGISPVIQATFSDELMTVRIADIRRMWTQIFSQLDESSSSFLQGSLHQLIADAFGDEVSFTYDLLPLFHGPATLHLGRHASGTLIVALEGVASSTKNVRTHINALHRGFQSMLPVTRIMQRTLNDRFAAEDIRMDQRIITQEEREQSHWQIRRTSHEDGRTFATASLGGTFILANDMEALEQILKQDTRIVTPTESSLIATIRLADGYTASGALAGLFPALENELPLADFLPDFAGMFLWSIEQRGLVTTVTVKTEK